MRLLTNEHEYFLTFWYLTVIIAQFNVFFFFFFFFFLLDGNCSYELLFLLLDGSCSYDLLLLLLLFQLSHHLPLYLHQAQSPVVRNDEVGVDDGEEGVYGEPQEAPWRTNQTNIRQIVQNFIILKEKGWKEMREREIEGKID